MSDYLRENGICIGNAIKYFRLKQGLAIELMAMELGMDVNVYALLEANELAADGKTLLRLTQLFKVSNIELLTLQLNLIEEQGVAASTTTIHQKELDLLERQYQNQLQLLREEARYLRGLLDSLTNKS